MMKPPPAPAGCTFHPTRTPVLIVTLSDPGVDGPEPTVRGLCLVCAPGFRRWWYDHELEQLPRPDEPSTVDVAP